MLTINEAIARFEANAEQNERWASGGLNPEANAEYAAEHRQLAAWLRELQERRAEPEITTGEWELKNHQWECDKCGCRINVKNPLDCDKWNYYYCPHCGTKMLIAVQRGR